MNSFLFHAFNKSIAGYKIFSTANDFMRMQLLLKYFQICERKPTFSDFLKNHPQDPIFHLLEFFKDKSCNIKLIAYCIMPTHLHLAIEATDPAHVSKFTNNIFNSYTRYFNLNHKRLGPLWQGRTKKVACTSDEQLLHLTRYIHLNPVTAYLVDSPEKWPWSSYHEYMEKETALPICEFKQRVGLTPKIYAEFVSSQIDYQRSLAHLKPFLTA